MATGGWGPPNGPGRPGGNGPGGQGWGGGPYGPPQGGPYGPPPPQPGPYPNQPSHPNPYPNPNPYPYGPQPTGPALRSRRGCLGFGLIGALLRSTSRAAKRLFAQGDDLVVDRTVDRVQTARTVLGTAATIVLILAYNANPDRWSDAAWQGAAQLLIAPFVLMVAAPLVVTGFIYYAPAHLRPHLRSRVRAPLKAVAWYVLSLVVIFGVFIPTSLLINPDESSLDWWQYALLLASLVVMVWGFPFFFFATLYSARSAFNSAMIHPMLPPVMTMSLVWVFVILNMGEGGLPGGGPIVQICATLGGPLSVTALSLWELRRMRTRFGITIRG